MSKETRTIRPFTGLGGLDGALNETVLYFGSEACLANDALTVDIASQEFLLRSVRLEWGSDERALEQFKTRISVASEDARFSPLISRLWPLQAVHS